MAVALCLLRSYLGLNVHRGETTVMKGGPARCSVLPAPQTRRLLITVPTRGGPSAVSRDRLGDPARELVRARRARRVAGGRDPRRPGRPGEACVDARRPGGARVHRDDERRGVGPRQARHGRLGHPLGRRAQGQVDRSAGVQDRPRRRPGARRSRAPRFLVPEVWVPDLGGARQPRAAAPALAPGQAAHLGDQPHLRGAHSVGACGAT